MPRVVEYIDDVAARLGRPVLMASFGRDVVDWLRDPDIRSKREAFLDRLTAAGFEWTPCGPPSDSGWRSVLGDVYLATPRYLPGGSDYEELRRYFEDLSGELLDPQIRFSVYQQPR